MIAAQVWAQIELTKAQKRNVDADTENKKDENPNITLEGENIKADTKKKDVEANKAAGVDTEESKARIER